MIDYYEKILSGIDSQIKVDEIIYGISWTAARLENGDVGVAMHTEGDTAKRMFKSLKGLTVEEASQAVMSWNMEEASEGQAVINAYYNTIDNVTELGANSDISGAMDNFDIDGKTICFVGHLVNHSGISEELLAKSKEYFILEREPKSGDLPDSACEYIIPKSDIVVITGSANVNKTMPRLLELSEKAEVIITGPTTTLCSGLEEFGVNRLYGVSITDPDGLAEVIVQKRTSVNKFSRRFCLDF